MTKQKEFDANFKDMLEEAIEEAIENEEKTYTPIAVEEGYPKPFSVLTKFIEDNELVVNPKDIDIINTEMGIDEESGEPYFFENYHINPLDIKIGVMSYHISGSIWHYFFRKNN